MTKKDFYQFLKNHDIFDEYHKNFKINKGKIREQESTFDFFQISPLRWIDEAFSWVKTSEGYTFWYTVNQQWFNELIK